MYKHKFDALFRRCNLYVAQMRPTARFTKSGGFTIVELLIVIVVIGILATLVLNSFSGAQRDARDVSRRSKLKTITTAIELYYQTNGYYPQIQDGSGAESGCGSQTDNWGHCDRLKILSDAIAPFYASLDPTSMSNATQGNYYYYYTSPGSINYQKYGIMVYLEGNGGQSDGGYYSNAYEAGNLMQYCLSKYTGASADWRWAGNNASCVGGD